MPIIKKIRKYDEITEGIYGPQHRYYQKIYGTRLGEQIWEEITEEEYNEQRNKRD